MNTYMKQHETNCDLLLRKLNKETNLWCMCSVKSYRKVKILLAVGDRFGPPLPV